MGWHKSPPPLPALWRLPPAAVEYLSHLLSSSSSLFPSAIPHPKLSFSAAAASVTGLIHSVPLLRPSPPPPPPPPALPRRRNSGAEAGCAVPLFRPYVATVPWHGGLRALLSQLFPRYGHYCGPNWSSGKDGGLNLWDRRPVDWLDFCCYCHDIGYDTHDQAQLLRADLAFLDCLERPRMATKGGAYAALVYRAMCIAGLRGVLIPYRMHLVRMQSAPPITEVLSSFVGKVASMRQFGSADRKDML